MRTKASALAGLLLALVLAPMLPLAAAAEPLTDGTGDASIFVWSSVGGTPAAPVPAGVADAVDLRQVTMTEGEDELSFRWEVVDATRPTNLFAQYAARFSRGEHEYVASLGYNAVSGFSVSSLYLVKADRWELVTRLDHQVDAAAGAFTASVPRVLLLDEKNRLPLKGDALEAFSAYGASYGNIGIGLAAGYSIYDRVPDGDATVDLPLERGGEAAGHLRAWSPEPVRVSNGGSTTFVYTLTIENALPRDDEVSLKALELPEGWTAHVQSPVLVPGGSSRQVPVLASVPFKHEHGGFSAFSVEARSTSDASAYGVARLGVLHTPIPQPAGHHPDLYLHTQPSPNGELSRVFPYRPVFMNTDADHTADAASVTPNSFRDGVSWAIDLDPGLLMGLDFDVEKLGQLAGAIHGKQPYETEVAVELWLTVEGEEETLLAEGAPQAIQLDPRAPTPFTIDLVPTEDADYVPYARDQNLRLRIRAPTLDFLCCNAATTPELMVEDFKLSLPLLEYHDRLAAAVMEGTGGVTLTGEGAVEKAGRPGDLLAYVFTLQNTGPAEDTFVVSTAGADAELGSLAPGGDVRLAPGESRRVTLGVRLPADATTDMRFEVLVFARSQTDPSVSAIGRTVSTVSFGAEAAGDESAVFAAAQDEANRTPGLTLPMVLVALVALALARRRSS